MKPKKNPNDRPLNPVHVIGTNASGLEKLPLYLQEIILSSRKIAAPKRILEIIPAWWMQSNPREALPELFPTDQPKELIAWLNQQDCQTIVLASGDPLWFGIGRFLLESLPKNRLVFHPCASSLQLAFARLGRPWQDATWISLHGRDSSPLSQYLKNRPKALAILTDPSKGGAKEVREYLRASGLEKSYAFWICERLGHPQERIQRLHPKEDLTDDLHPLHIVILLAESPLEPDPKELPLFGIEDGDYLQHDDRPGLMTKREVRIQLIADLELPKEGVIWDICAGVGSIGLEAIRVRPKLQLVAIEKRLGAYKLIEENAKRLLVKPHAILEAEALEALTRLNIQKELCSPDRVILGGGGSKRKELLEVILRRLNPKGIVVIPLATIEAISELTNILKEAGCAASISQHQTSRGVSLNLGTRLAPMNPVFILKGKFE